MEGPVVFPLGFETSKAYAQVNALAGHAQRTFANVKGNPFAIANQGAVNFNRTLASTNDRFVAFAATAAVLYGVANAFKSVFNSAIQVEKALAEIQVNVKTTSSELKSLSSGLFDVADATSQSFYTAASAAAEFGRQGLKLSQILKATQAALTLTQTTGMNSSESVQTLTAAVNTFTKQGLTYEEVVNKMAAADTSFAVSSKDLAEGVRRVGSTALDANISFEQLLATITSLQQKTSRGGSVIGNSLKTIFTRLQREDSSTQLENLGIQTKDADGNFRNQLTVLSELAKTYDKLTASQQASVSEMVGGVYQINIVKALFQDLGREANVYSQALAVVKNAQNDAFVKSEFLSGTTASKINTLKNSFVELGGEIGKLGLNDATKNFAGQIASAIGSLNSALSADADVASTGDKIGQSLVKGIVSAVTGPGLALLLKGVAQLGAGVIGRFGADVKNQFVTPGVAKTQRGAANIAEESRLRIASLEAERKISEQVLRGNTALVERNRLINQMLAAQARLGQSLAVTGGVGKAGSPNPFPQPPGPLPGRRRNFAVGYTPIQSEISQIAQGVGGASKNARAVKRTIKTSRNKTERVVVNTDEHIIRNYMGSGADAVFNKDMVRAAGGANKLSLFGSVQRVFAGGFAPKLTLSQAKAIRDQYPGRVDRESGGSFYSDKYRSIAVAKGVKNPFYTFLHELGHYKDSKTIKLLDSVHSGGKTGVEALMHRMGDGAVGSTMATMVQEKRANLYALNTLKGVGAKGASKDYIDFATPNFNTYVDQSRANLSGLLSYQKGENGKYYQNEQRKAMLNRLDFGKPYGSRLGKLKFKDHSSRHDSLQSRLGLAGGYIPSLAGGSVPFNKRGPKELVKLLKSGNRIQAKGAENALRKMGYFNKASSISLGIPTSFLSERALVNGPKEGIVGNAISKELARRGTLKDPTLVQRGFPLSSLSNSAVSKIAKDTSRSQFSDSLVRGAQKFRAERVAPIIEKRKSIVGVRKAENFQRLRSEAAISASSQDRRQQGSSYVAAVQQRFERQQASRQRELERARASRAEDNKRRALEGNRSAAGVRASDRERILRVEEERKDRKIQQAQRNEAARATFFNSVGANPYASRSQLENQARLSGLAREDSRYRGNNVVSRGYDAIAQKTGLRSKFVSRDVDSAAKQTRTNRNQQFSSKLTPFAFGGAFLGQIAGDAIGGGAGKFAGSAIGGAATLGALGSTFGPGGAAIGAGIGVFSALVESIKTSVVPLEKLTNQINEFGAQAEKQQAAITGFFNSRDNLKALTADPEADLEQIRSTVKQQTSALADLPADFRERILGAKDEKEQSKIANEFLGKQAKQSSFGTALGALTSTADKNNSGLGLTFRKFVSNDRDDSELKFGDLEKGATREKINSIVGSIINSVDIDGLKAIAADNTNASQGQARYALESLDTGKFSQFLKDIEGLNVAPEEALSTFNQKTLPSIKGAELVAFEQAALMAKKRLDELAVSTDRITRAQEQTKSAVIDFQRYIDSFSSRNKALKAIDSLSENRKSSRLGLIAQDPSTNTGYKDIISTARELSSIALQEKNTKRDTSQGIVEFSKKLTEELGRSKIDDAFGKDFIAQLTTDATDESKVPALLQKLNGGINNIEGVSRDSVAALRDMSMNYDIELAQLDQAKQIALEQLSVMQSINNKQKFDELINVSRNTSPIDRAFDELDFRDLKDEFFGATNDERKTRDKEISEATRLRDPNKVRGLISDDAEIARELLDANDKKKARGEIGLNESQVGQLQKAVLKDNIVNSFGIQSDSIQEQLAGRNSRNQPFVRKTLEQSEFDLAKGDGSAQAIQGVISKLVGAAGQIADPESQDKKDLLGLADSLKSQLQSIIAGTNIFEPASQRISTLTASDTTTSQDKASLKTLQEFLDAGDVEGAKKFTGEGNNFSDGLRKEFTAFLNGITTSVMDEGITKRFENPSQAFDSQKLFADVVTGQLIPSQDTLKTSLGSLDTSVTQLTAVMAAEARVATAAAAGSQIASDQVAADKKLNDLTVERSKVFKLDQGDRDAYAQNIGVFDRTNREAIEKSKGNSSVSATERAEAQDFLSRLQNSQLTGDDYTKGFENLTKIRNKTRVGVSTDDSDRSTFIQSYVKSRDKGETKIAGSLDEQIKALNETIKELGDKLKAQNEVTDKTRKESDAVLKGSTETPAVPGSLSVNVSGLDGGALASLKDDISALVQDKLKEMFTMSKTNPRLFESMFA